MEVIKNKKEEKLEIIKTKIARGGFAIVCTDAC